MEVKMIKGFLIVLLLMLLLLGIMFGGSMFIKYQSQPKEATFGDLMEELDNEKVKEVKTK